MTQDAFARVSAVALQSAESLLRDWLPAGQKKGDNYLVGNLQGDKGSSLSVSIPRGIWKDFASGEGGGDLISLYAAIHGIEQGEAMQQVAEMVSISDVAPAAKTDDEVEIFASAPEGAEPPNLDHYQYGAPSRIWAWHTADGLVAGYTARYDHEGKKSFSQCSWGRQKGRVGWQKKAMRKPRPLFRLPQLLASPERPVIVVEGEKCADFLQDFIFARNPDGALVTTWAGGANATPYTDWEPLRARGRVVIIPDHDTAGYWAAHNIRDYLGDHAVVYYPPATLPEHGDVADLDEAQILDLLNGANPPHPDYLPQDKPAIDSPIDAMPGTPEIDNKGQNDAKKSKPAQSRQRPVYRVLGYNHGLYYYLPDGSRQVVALTAREHAKNQLLTIAPLDHWEQFFPGAKASVDWTAVANNLIQTAHSAGVYSTERIRGRGCWQDGSDNVYHAGADLIVGTERIEITQYSSRYVYELASDIEMSANMPAEDTEAQMLQGLISALNWQDPMHAKLFAGWVVLAPFCGALEWRPHLWLSGRSGTGKTWVLNNIVSPLVGDLSIFADGKATEPGLRQAIRSDALPVIIDEAESEDMHAQQRIQNIITLARSASSTKDAAIYKGTQSGVAQKYQPRSMFLFSSIGVAAVQRADMSRIASLELTPGTPEHFVKKLLPLAYATVQQDDFCHAIRARTLLNLDTVRSNASEIGRAVGGMVSDSRTGDQYGALLAGALLLQHTKKLTTADALEYVQGLDLRLVTDYRPTPDEDVCLGILLDAFIEIETSDGRIKRPIGETLEAISDMPGNYSDKQVYTDALARYGVVVREDTVYILDAHSELKKVYRDSPYADKWRSQFKRISGATHKVIWTGGRSIRATGLALEKFAKQKKLNTN